MHKVARPLGDLVSPQPSVRLQPSSLHLCSDSQLHPQAPSVHLDKIIKIRLSLHPTRLEHLVNRMHHNLLHLAEVTLTLSELLASKINSSKILGRLVHLRRTINNNNNSPRQAYLGGEVHLDSRINHLVHLVRI